MEYAVSLNFKFDTADKIREIGGLFKTIHESAMETEEIVALFRPYSEEAAGLLPALIENDNWERYNFTASEEIKITDKKVSIANVVGMGADEFVPEFMRFIVALGGTPLTCKAMEDEGGIVCKYTKNGIQCEEKSLWD